MPQDIQDAAALKGVGGLRRVVNAAGYSMAGLTAAWRHESAFRQLCMMNLVLLPLAFWFDVSRSERALLVMAPLLCLIVELLNSAIEAVVDRVSLELHPLSKNAKDMGSAAQFMALTLVTLVWAIVLL